VIGVGDLVVCLDNSTKYHEAWAFKLQLGRIYKVAAAGIPNHAQTYPCLGFLEIMTGANVVAAFDATRFRKIRPDEHEKCEPEFVTLLETFKRKVEVSGHVGGGR
jgi:hypothetical protein